MKNYTFILLILAMSSFSKGSIKSDKQLNDFIDSRIEFSIAQYKLMDASLPDDQMPKTLDKEGKLVTSNTKWWCSGFFPGTLWYLYEMSKDEEILKIAQKRTLILDPEKFNTKTHDLGFILNCSYGNGYRLTNNPEYLDVLLTGSKSLMTRYNINLGLIKSWDNNKWQYPVIIDNMMNLELLFLASKHSGDQTFYKASVSHADKTIENHFRQDYSTYHLVAYDTLTGKALKKQTVQGDADESAWARGQAWGLYGYTVMYRETKDPKYLAQAKKIAEFILSHPNLPADKIPYWDFNAKDIPNSLRDASAAAIIASGLIELSDYCKGRKKKEYFNSAKSILLTLGSEAYLAKKGGNGNFLLMHGVGHFPNNTEVDVPLTYADYYFIEGLVRLKNRL